MYQTIADLPETLQKVLPADAQEIYLETYQESYKSYNDKQGGQMGRNSVAHRDAMMAVKNNFDKDSRTGKYYPKGQVPQGEEEQEDEGLLEKIF